MHIHAATPGSLGHQETYSLVPLSQRLAEAAAQEPETGPESRDFVGDTVRRILRDQLVAMIMGADEEESGIPPLEYEL